MTTMTPLHLMSKKIATKNDGVDGFGAPQPFSLNDADEVDQGEPNAPENEDTNENAGSGPKKTTFLKMIPARSSFGNT